MSNWIWLLFFVPFLIFVPMLFPDGRLASRRWRPVAWIAGAAIGVGAVTTALAPGVMNNNGRYKVANPIGIQGAKTLLFLVGAVSFPLLLVTLTLLGVLEIPALSRVLATLFN